MTDEEHDVMRRNEILSALKEIKNYEDSDFKVVKDKLDTLCGAGLYELYSKIHYFKKPS